VRILIADDHAVLRKGLRQLLAEEYPDVQIGEASTTAETLDLVSSQPWDMLVLDIFMPGRTGLEVLHEVRRHRPDLPVLVLTSAPEEQLAVRMLKAGAAGYLNKRTAPEELIGAAKKILAGGRYVSAELAEQLAIQIAQRPHMSAADLSDREYAVLRMIVAGYAIKEIASEFSISTKTVSTYHVRIWKKFGVKNDVDLVRRAAALGVTRLER
jgi:DNA-binding NarL/FixJ family response regulator